MPPKRTLLITALVALLVTASGCSVLGGGSGQGDEIAQRAQQSMQDVETYEVDMSLDMNAQDSDVSVSLTADGAVDTADERMRMEMSLRGQSITQYLIGDTQYVNRGGTWQTQDVADRDIWNQQTVAQQREILNGSAVTLEGNTTIDGTDVYELDVDIDEGQLMDVVQSQQGASTISDVSLDDFSYTMYVSHETDHIKRIQADMTMSMQGETVNADLEMTISNVDGNVSIELPPEAENGQAAN